ncbi:MAG: hypothetical protein KDI07_25805, partial [Anaerolineae bacterium]|nr:hypothetical protein [Anaerolineae bacterium]
MDARLRGHDEINEIRTRVRPAIHPQRKRADRSPPFRILCATTPRLLAVLGLRLDPAGVQDRLGIAARLLEAL